MLNRELPSIYNYEKDNQAAIVTDLSRILIEQYVQEGNRIKNQEEYVEAMTNVMGNLFIRYRRNINNHGEYYGNEPYMLFSRDNNMYVKRKVNKEDNDQLIFEIINNDKIEKKVKYSRLNSMKLGITRTKRDVIFYLLEKNGIGIVINGKQFVSTTQLIINPLSDWNSDILNTSIEKRLLLYYALDGNYFACFVYKEVYDDKKPLAYIKVKSEKRDAKSKIIPASANQIEIVNTINTLWPESLRRFFYYRRVFSDSELQGGRFYSVFTLMPKVDRERILKIGQEYIEIDFTAFVPNVIKHVVDDTFFDERPYNIVARTLLNSKKSGIEYCDELKNELTTILSNCLKRVVLAHLYNDHIEEDQLNDINKNPECWRILVDHGLANTVQELMICSSKVKSIQDRIERFRVREYQLYELRQKRWVENTCRTIPCPRFKVSPKNVFKAMKRSLKEIEPFLLTSNCGWTQLVESELLVKISKDLEQDGLLPLFVHDAFYLPIEYENKYRELSSIYLDSIVNEYIDSILTEENIICSIDELSKYIKCCLCSSQIKLYKDRIQNDNDVKLITNKIIKMFYIKYSLKYFRSKCNRFIYPHLIRNNKNKYYLFNSLIRELITKE